MPHVRIETNQVISNANTKVLMNQITDLVVQELRKPKDYVQVLVGPPSLMSFAGTTAPTAIVTVRSVGFKSGRIGPLSAGISGILEETLDIPPDRVFINFLDVPPQHWAWNGRTFE